MAASSCVAIHGATDESDSDFVTSILEHTVALPKFIRMHVAFQLHSLHVKELPSTSKVHGL